MKNNSLGIPIIELKKIKSKFLYRIYLDKDNYPFYYIIKLDKKTESIKDSSMIIRKDLDSHISMYLNDGWEKINLT